VREIPTGAEWIHELKWDGYRIIARRENSADP
jgi:ATP-dependent DNA ligase